MQIRAKITKLSMRKYQFRMDRVKRVSKKETKAALKRIKEKTVKYANELIIKDSRTRAPRKRGKTKRGLIWTIILYIGVIVGNDEEEERASIV